MAWCSVKKTGTTLASYPKKGEVAGSWRRLHHEELHNLYASPNIVRVVKSRKVRSTGHAARMGEMRNTYKILI
jgi:hypothetical protein